MVKLSFIKFKASDLQKTLLRQRKDKTQTGGLILKVIFDKGIIWRIYKEFSKFKNKEAHSLL